MQKHKTLNTISLPKGRKGAPDLKRQALMTSTIRAQNVQHHKNYAEANAMKAAIQRAQNYNNHKTEYENLAIAANRRPGIHAIAMARMDALKALLNI